MRKTSDVLAAETDLTSKNAEALPAEAAKKPTANEPSMPANASADIGATMLPVDYRPSESEEFMNPMQLLYFQHKLEAWKAELLDDASDTITGLSQENLHQPDQMDRAQIESNAALDLRTRDRERKLLQKIESPFAGLTMAAMAIVSRPMSRSICAGSKHGRSPRSVCMPRNVMSVWSACIATTS